MTCCPFGPAISLPGVVCFFAMIFTFAFGGDCAFFYTQLSESNGYSDVTGAFAIGVWQAGLAVYAQTSYGYYYASSYCISAGPIPDAAIRAGRAFGTISMFFAVPAFIICLLPCCSPNKQAFTMGAGLCGFLCVTSILTMSVNASVLCKPEFNCKYGRTTYFCIAASVMWLITAILLCIIPKTVREDAYTTPPAAATPATAATPTPASEVTVQRTPNPDGSSVTVITTTSTTNADGSKTVTQQTAIEPAAPETAAAATVAAIPPETEPAKTY